MESSIVRKRQSAELNTNALKNLLDLIFPKLPKWMADRIPSNIIIDSPVLGVSVEVSKLNKKSGKFWLWQVSVEQSNFEKLKDYIRRAEQQDSLTQLPRTNQGSSKSNAEKLIYEIFKQEEVIFFHNAYGVFPNTLEMRSPDFLVFYKSECRILEVDGSQHNESRESDYTRDRMFDKFDIRVTRFTASQCMREPDTVVQEFMSLFKNYKKKFEDPEDLGVIDVDSRKVRNTKVKPI
jgi:Protein of unknown function (DUF559)